MTKIITGTMTSNITDLSRHHTRDEYNILNYSNKVRARKSPFSRRTYVPMQRGNKTLTRAADDRGTWRRDLG